MKIHRADSRGTMSIDWLKTNYSFSFANWYNPEKMGFGALRVLNDDLIAPHSGFPPHSHANMEIITLVTNGVITHSDDMGNENTKIHEGEVQIMSAGTGVTHAEYNKEGAPLSLFQVWIEPNEINTEPRYDQAKIAWMEKGYTKIVGPLNSDFPLHLQQEAYISSLSFGENESLTYLPHSSSNGVYIFNINAIVTIGNEELKERDAAEVTGQKEILFTGRKPGTILLFEVPFNI